MDAHRNHGAEWSELPRMRGFTLIELICVITILGILAAFTAPSMFDYGAFKARGYADELASALQYAQSVAASSGCDVQVTIDTTGYYALQRAAAGSSCASSGTFVTPVLRSDGSALSDTTPTGVPVSANTLTFIAGANITTTAPLPVTVDNFALTIDSNSGYVQLP